MGLPSATSGRTPGRAPEPYYDYLAPMERRVAGVQEHHGFEEDSMRSRPRLARRAPLGTSGGYHVQSTLRLFAAQSGTGA